MEINGMHLKTHNFSLIATIISKIKTSDTYSHILLPVQITDQCDLILGFYGSKKAAQLMCYLSFHAYWWLP